VKYDRVEYYAGYKGEERPVAVYVGELRLEVVRLISVKRIQEKGGSRFIEIFECLLANGETVKIERELEI